MSSLRDARLQRALDNAPDAEARAPATIRSAIADFAAQAVAPAAVRAPAPVPQVPWWRGLFGASGSRMPWNGAFATLLIAGVVGVLWHNEEVPGPRSDAPDITAKPEAATAPAPAPVPQVPPAAGVAAPAPAAAPKPAPAPGAEVLAGRKAGAAERARAAESERSERDTPGMKARREAERNVQLRMESEKAADTAKKDAALPPPAMAPAPVAPAAPPPPTPAPAQRAEEPAAMARAPAAAAPAKSAPPPGAAAESFAPALPSTWSRLMLSYDGRLAVVPQGEKPALTSALQRAAAATARESFTGAVVASIGIAGPSGVMGVLEASETHLRWRPSAAGAPAAFEGRPSQRQLQELLAAVREAVPR